MKDIGYFLVIAFLPLMVGLWAFVLFTLSRLSGWHRLVGAYGTTKRFDGTIKRFQSARVTGVQLTSALNIGHNDQGLFMVAVVPFRIFLKPVLIPWSSVTAEKTEGFLFNGYRLRFQETEGVYMDVNDRLFRQFLSLVEDTHNH